MQRIILLITFCLLISCKNQNEISQEIFSTDIDNYWTAYDEIVNTEDTTLQLKYSLQGALLDMHWEEISNELKNKLLKKARE